MPRAGKRIMDVEQPQVFPVTKADLTLRQDIALILARACTGLSSSDLSPKMKGGAFPFTIGRISHGFNVRPDLCAVDNKADPKNYLGLFYTDSLVHDPRALKLLVDIIGEDKVILGSDYPFPLGELEPGKLIDSMEEFDEELKDKLKARNALSFLNLERKHFE